MTQGPFMFGADFRAGAAGRAPSRRPRIAAAPAGIAAGHEQARPGCRRSSPQTAERLAARPAAPRGGRRPQPGSRSRPRRRPRDRKVAGEALDADPLGPMADAARLRCSHQHGAASRAAGQRGDGRAGRGDAEALRPSTASKAASCSVRPTSRPATGASNGPTAVSSSTAAVSARRAGGRRAASRNRSLKDWSHEPGERSQPAAAEAGRSRSPSARSGPVAKTAEDLEQVFDVPVMVSAVLGSSKVRSATCSRSCRARCWNSTGVSARRSTSSSTSGWWRAARSSSSRTGSA